MNFAFSEEQLALRAAARPFLEAHSGSRQVRAALLTEAGYDAQVWRRIAQDLGFTALIVPEAYGGLGGSYVDLVAIMEEMGRALLCAPFFSTACLATAALLTCADESQKQAHLPAIAAGERTATLAYAEPAGRWDAGGIGATATPSGAGFVLAGTKAYVVDGHTADLLIVAARQPGSTGEDGIGLFLVPGDAPGLSRRPCATLDGTRRLAQVVLAKVPVPREALLGPTKDADAGSGWAGLQRTLDLACVALSAEQVGGAQRCLDMAVDYAKVRVQFGRPIGSFQAIKHKCADMLLEVESARSASYYAGWAASASPDELPEVAPLAKACASEAYFRCAAENIQIHGGIGFTWEHDAHLYFRRAKSSEVLLGGPALHRRRLARVMGLSADATPPTQEGARE